MGRGCAGVNVSKEGWVNSRKQGVPWLPKLEDQTWEETVERAEMFEKYHSKVDEVYRMFDEKIKSRVSELAKRATGLGAKSVNTENEMARQGGTFLHSVLENLMRAVAHKTMTIEQVKEKYTKVSDDWHLKPAQFDELVELVKSIYQQIKDIQERIEPGKEPKILLEAFSADNLRDVGGTVDIIAIFSNNTAAIFDYKTSSRLNPVGWTSSGRDVIRAPLPLGDIRAYDLAMTEYRRQWKEVLGVKEVIHTRLIPIAVSYATKPSEGQTEPKKAFIDLVAYNPYNEFMRQIPVGGEKSKWGGINKLIEKQYRLIQDLEKSYQKSKSEEERRKLMGRITAVEKGIIRMITENDIETTINTMYALKEEVALRLNEPDLMENGQANEHAISLEEAQLLKSEMDVYADMIKHTRSYFVDLEKTDPDLFKSLEGKFGAISHGFATVKADLERRIETLTLNDVNDRHKDSDGNLLPYSELTASDLVFSRMSAIDNPIFETAWKIIQEAQHDVKMKFNVLDNKVHEVTDALFKWAHDNGMDRMDAFKMIINEETGNLIAKLNPEFFDKIAAAIDKKQPEDIKFMKDNFDIKDKDQWLINYAARKKFFEQDLKLSLNNLETVFDPTTNTIEKTSAQLKKIYDKRVEEWVAQNDLINSNEAWVNLANRKRYLKIKKSSLEANTSAAYKAIAGIKPLVDYYEMWTSYMEEFSEILGITSYSDLPYNFIPNIRKEMLEHLTKDNLNIFGAAKEFVDSFNVREEDVYINHVSSDGLVRKIPILYMNRIVDPKTGKTDLSRKSYDLSTSLKIFGHMAYNYEHMSKIEPKILALRTLMGDPSAEQGGVEVRNRLGQKIIGKFEPYLTKEGRTTETYRLFEDITDYYLYGIKFKDNSLIKGLDTVHLLTKAKNFNSSIKLGFAVIPAMGAFSAGTLGSYFTGKKGIAYTDAMFRQAVSWIVSAAPKYKAFTKYIDPENDNFLERAMHKDMASWKKKWMSDRALFKFLRDADQRIMHNIAVAMSQNYGLDETGYIVRLNRRTITDEERKKYKTLWDLTTIDEKGNAKIEGISKEGYIAFRQAIKDVAQEIIGNMNPDDIGKMDTSLYINQFMAFRTWMPEVVRERIGGLKWNPTVQAMKWGRYSVLSQEFKHELSDQEKIDYKVFATYMLSHFIPKLATLAADVALFGIAPSRMLKSQNLDRARAHYQKWLIENKSAEKAGVTFEDYLEIKEAQIKAVIVEIRVIATIMAMATVLGMKGDDGEPNYYANWFTRTMYKVFTKTGSELTFMWNPTEFERLLKNPFPVVSLITQFKNTMVNTFDETRDTIFGENSKQDKAPMWYYSSQWVPGLSQLTRFFEVFEQQKKTSYQIMGVN